MNDRTPGPRPQELPEDALDFEADEESSILGDVPAQPSERPAHSAQDQPGLTGGATLSESAHEDNVSLDDLSPDTLIDDSGARSPFERGEDRPLDEELSIVDETDIGGGAGLDEAELARSAPLDGEPWTDEVVPGESGRKGSARH